MKFQALVFLLLLSTALHAAPADPTPPLITQWEPADGAQFDLPVYGGLDVLVDFKFYEPDNSGLLGSVRAFAPGGVTLTLRALGVTHDLQNDGARGYFYLSSTPQVGLTQAGDYIIQGISCNGSNVCVSRTSKFTLLTRTASAQLRGLVIGPHPLRCPGSKLIFSEASSGDFSASVFSERGALKKHWPVLNTDSDGKSVFLPCEGLAPGVWRLELRPLQGQFGGKPMKARLWVE